MTPSTAIVRFILDGKTVEIPDPPPTESLLQCLRDRLGCHGVKEGCAEGDCGACTVVLGEATGDRIDYRAVNACIRMLPTVDGREVVTAESLSAPQEALHPVQQAMLDCHASQCGFCTPGFVMSLFGLWLARPDADREAVLDALSGNLCRCTGYRPIIEAGLAMNQLPEPVSVWNRAEAQSPERRARLAAIARDDTLSIRAGAGFTAPRTLNELASLLEAQPQSLVLAGGTDVGLWVTKHLRDLPHVVYLGEVAELRTVTQDAMGYRVIGAAVPLTEAFAALRSDWPELHELAQRFASPPVCNSGTLCGNIANGSPIGDSMPVLLALGAELDLRRGARTRRLPLDQFYLDYRRTALEPGEFVAAVRIPPRGPGQRLSAWKVSKRYDQDISAVCLAVWLHENDRAVVGARVGVGGMAATPKRAARAEAALTGRPLDPDSVEAAIAALAQDFSPMTDMRASSAYRMQVAGNLLRRLHLARQSGAALRVEQVSAS
jgi:xanthine dehydrogenase small subunit